MILDWCKKTLENHIRGDILEFRGNTMLTEMRGGYKMKFGSLIIEPVIGILTSLQFIARYIIIPYMKNKEGIPTQYNKIKIILSLFSFVSFLGYFMYMIFNDYVLN